MDRPFTTRPSPDLGALLGCADPPYLIPGSGTLALDAAIMNLFEPGQRVAVARTGFFGTRLAEIARAQQLEVVDVPVETGAAVDPRARRGGADGADGLLSVHVETATGVRHPIEELARVAAEAGVAFVVDGIASVGGELLDVDGWGITAVATGTQKGLEAPPGLGIVALGPGRARRMPRGRGARRPGTWTCRRGTTTAGSGGAGTPPGDDADQPGAGPGVEPAPAPRGGAGRGGLPAGRPGQARAGGPAGDLGLEPVPDAGVEANLVVRRVGRGPQGDPGAPAGAGDHDLGRARSHGRARPSGSG